MKTFIENINLSFINDYAVFFYLIAFAGILFMAIKLVLSLNNMKHGVDAINLNVNDINAKVNDSQLKVNFINKGTQERVGLVMKTLALYNMLRYTMKRENREFSKHMRDYEKNQADKKRIL